MLTLIRCPFYSPVLPQWHVKDPGHSAKSADGRSQLNTRTLLTQRSRSRLTIPLSRQSVGTYSETRYHATLSGSIRPQSSQLAGPLWIYLGIKEWNYCARANLHFKKKKKKRRRGMNDLTFSTHPRKPGKSYRHYHTGTRVTLKHFRLSAENTSDSFCSCCCCFLGGNLGDEQRSSSTFFSFFFFCGSLIV